MSNNEVNFGLKCSGFLYEFARVLYTWKFQFDLVPASGLRLINFCILM
jgi:hypothetical protein